MNYIKVFLIINSINTPDSIKSIDILLQFNIFKRMSKKVKGHFNCTANLFYIYRRFSMCSHGGYYCGLTSLGGGSTYVKCNSLTHIQTKTTENTSTT